MLSSGFVLAAVVLTLTVSGQAGSVDDSQRTEVDVDHGPNVSEGASASPDVNMDSGLLRLRQGEAEQLVPHHQLHKQSPANHNLLEVSHPFQLPLEPAVEDTDSRMPAVTQLQQHRLSKRDYPRWHHAFAPKTPIYSGSWRASQLAERKRFLPFHPLARFRGLSSGRGNSMGRNSVAGGGSRGSAAVPSMTEDLDDRWAGGSRGSITPFSDMLVADMPGHPMQADHPYTPDGGLDELVDQQLGLEQQQQQDQDQQDDDVAIEEAFRHRLGSVLGKTSGARNRNMLLQEEQQRQAARQNEEDASVLKAGDLLKYLLAVNGNSNVGSSLRFGFTK